MLPTFTLTDCPDSRQRIRQRRAAEKGRGVRYRQEEKVRKGLEPAERKKKAAQCRRWWKREESRGEKQSSVTCLPLLFSCRLIGNRCRFRFSRWALKGSTGAFVADVARAAFVGSPWSGGLQLRMQLPVRRGGRRRQHQSFQRGHLRLQDVNLGNKRQTQSVH